MRDLHLCIFDAYIPWEKNYNYFFKKISLAKVMIYFNCLSFRIWMTFEKKNHLNYELLTLTLCTHNPGTGANPHQLHWFESVIYTRFNLISNINRTSQVSNLEINTLYAWSASMYFDCLSFRIWMMITNY